MSSDTVEKEKVSKEGKEGKIVIDDETPVERKLTYEEYHDKFVREFTRLPVQIQEALLEEEMKKILKEEGTETLEHLIKTAKNKTEKTKLRLKKKLLEKKLNSL
jgi:hypothetical protein